MPSVDQIQTSDPGKRTVSIVAKGLSGTKKLVRAANDTNLQ